MTGSFPPFADFYGAVNDGRTPFPWQARLAELVLQSGWPAEIGIPTGLGKTSCLDIGIWALAAQGDRPARERTLPTRLWYVVNRRLLVDAAYGHGEKLVGMLANPEAHEVEQVASRLRSIAGFAGDSDAPLAVTRLRGGAELGARPPHPAMPSIIFATVPMFASTWLFRGYASSQMMRSVDAAHAGVDAAVLLDEAHISKPLHRLQQPLAQCDIGDPSVLLPDGRSRTHITSLTATGDAEDPFVLDDDDLEHDVVRQRLGAHKPICLKPVDRKAKQLAKDLAATLTEELEQVDQPCAAVVFTNTPSRAREVADQVANLTAKKSSVLHESDLCVLTGRMRKREADAMRQLILDPQRGAPSDRSQTEPRERHLIVVATQTLEVGADLDFDLLITESCGARALVQRLGRLNRLGRKHTARGVIVHPSKEAAWEIYGDEPGRVWDRLSERIGFGHELDLGPGLARDAVGEPDDAPPEVGELLPAHLWEWAKTTTPPPGEAPVELFFEGFDISGPRVSVIWRACIPDSGARLVPSVHIDESVSLPLYEIRDVLDRERDPDRMITRLSRDRVTVERVPTSNLRPNDVVVLNPEDGHYDSNGWGPEIEEAVPDVSLDRWPGLPLDTQALSHWAPGSDLAAIKEIVTQLETDDEADLDELGEQALRAVRDLAPRCEAQQDWDSLVAELQPTIDTSVMMLVRKSSARRWRESMLVAADAFDDLSALAKSEKLSDHLNTVGGLAGRIAASIGLPDELVEAVAAAGRFHDLGKIDPRFQRWLDPEGDAPDPLAKSSTPRSRWRASRDASDWPTGGRHEALSARMLDAWLDTETQNGQDWDRDLVIHLVISHHGHGRPMISPVEDSSSTEFWSSIEADEIKVSGDLSVADWNQPSRFRRCCERYGYWGLALLEAIVRQADHMASAAVVGRAVGVA